MARLLVTSALPYANGPIHLGHLLEVIQTDIFVRYHKLAGDEVVYVCADDQHGTAIEIGAKKRGRTPEELIAEFSEQHQRAFRGFGIEFTTYGGTHTAANRKNVEGAFAHLQKYIAPRPIELTFCEKDQRFLPDRYVRGTCPRCGAKDQYGDSCEECKAAYNPTELKDARCSTCGAPPTRKVSDHYFFDLEAFRPLLTQIAEGTSKPELDPQIRNAMKGWLAQKLESWCISRDGPYFGFEIPNDFDKFFYVWWDAPIAYISNTPTPWQASAWQGATRLDLEPTQVWHFIGKDIIYFHTLFWPAVLSGLHHTLPHRIVVHGMLNLRGEKMSKSKGVMRTAEEYLAAPGLLPEHLRFYYASGLTSHPEDIDFSAEDFRNRVNADLVNNLANFCHRTLSLLRSRFDGWVRGSSVHPAWAQVITQLKSAVADYETLNFKSAVAKIVSAGNAGNGFLQERTPWAAPAQQAQEDLSLAANMVYRIAIALNPITPQMSEEIFRRLGAKLHFETMSSANPSLMDRQVLDGAPLMPRISAEAVAGLGF